MLEYFGADIGRSNVKIVHGPEDGRFTFPSFVCPGKELDLVGQVMEGSELDNLIVTINGKEWFMGELAKLHGGSREFSKDKANHQNTIPLLLASLAIKAEDGQELKPKIVTGIPISDHKHQAKAFEERAVGTYQVEVNRKKVHISIEPHNFQVFPEGAAVGWDMALDWNGAVYNSAMFTKVIAIVEIGWKTVNFCVLRKMVYDDSQSGTMPIGMHKAFSAYYKRVSRSRDLPMAKVEASFSLDGSSEIQALAHEIMDSLSMYWPDQDEFDEMYIAGGGCLDLRKYLTTWPLMPVSYPIYANANGMYKLARRLL